MKKMVSLLLVTSFVVSGLFAAGSIDTVTVEGKVALVSNYPTITSAGSTWIIPPQAFYRFAWENGIKAGDTLKIEGLTRAERDGRGQAFAEIEGLENAKMIMPNKVWVNGKAVDLAAYAEELRSRGVNGHGNMMSRPEMKDRSEMKGRSNQTERSSKKVNQRR